MGGWPCLLWRYCNSLVSHLCQQGCVDGYVVLTLLNQRNKKLYDWCYALCTNTHFHRLWWAAKETKLTAPKSITIFMKLEQVAGEFMTELLVTQALVMKVCSFCSVSHESNFHRLICNATVFIWCDVICGLICVSYYLTGQSTVLQRSEMQFLFVAICLQ